MPAQRIHDAARELAKRDPVMNRLVADDAVVAELVTVRGIGPWTAEMFLIFTLKRLDVWPVGDYGVRAGYARAYGLRELPTARELGPRGDPFRPYRTLAAWYCWQILS